jgi:cephalosporin-C deacetylase-like acetyl esterase
MTDIQSEIRRFHQISGKHGKVELVEGKDGETVGPCSKESLNLLFDHFGIKFSNNKPIHLTAAGELANSAARQKRLVEQLTGHIQQLERFSGKARDKYILEGTDRSSVKSFEKDAETFRDYFSKEIIGSIDGPLAEMNPRIRKVYDRKNWTGYEVVLDVLPGSEGENPPVFAWGILCVPKGIKKGEKRPVVVCQHGLEGVPKDTIERTDGYRAYKSYAARLADKGFITFAPHNPYRGLERFRMIQRKANPLKLSLFSFIVRQHEQILNWLESLPFVDKKRIAFYGLSYGGKTAMRVPAILQRYCLSICSADFNDWVKKIVSVEIRFSYQYTVEWELMEFNLGHTFNYAEMSYLIFPRPFMVERGHDDGVSIDEWVAYEYAKIRRFYNKLGRGDDTEIEFFNGPHTINGQGTFRFLEKHLDWPGKTN